jgi:uncharacterized protein (DUF427 family)
MATATWNGVIIAESSRTQIVEGNHYFPVDSVKQEYLQENTTTTVCPWKGVASYYDIVIDGKTNKGAAWYYPEPKFAASNIRNHIAFWRGVTVQE